MPGHGSPSVPPGERRADSQRDSSATITLNTPINKTLRDVLWAYAKAMRTGATVTDIVDIDTAVTNNSKAEFTAALKNIVKGYET